MEQTKSERKANDEDGVYLNLICIENDRMRKIQESAPKGQFLRSIILNKLMSGASLTKSLGRCRKDCYNLCTVSRSGTEKCENLQTFTAPETFQKALADPQR